MLVIFSELAVALLGHMHVPSYDDYEWSKPTSANKKRLFIGPIINLKCKVLTISSNHRSRRPLPGFGPLPCLGFGDGLHQL